jgi:ribokinase
VTRKIFVVGSINIDLVASVPRMPAEGETLTGKSFATYPGGKGANQAVAAARLGADVVMVGRLGEDNFANQLRGELEASGVKTQCVLNVRKPSGSAMILVTPQGHNSIVVIPGANHELGPGDLDGHLDELRDAAMVLAQLEIPLETVEHLGELTAALGVPFLLDPAPAQALSAETLRNVTWLTPNESEARSLLEHLGYSMAEDVIGDAAIAEAAERILATGVRNVIFKLGARGVYLSGKDVAPTYIAPYTVQAVDTTAAGDAFNGGFAYGLAQGLPPEKAAQFACAVAALMSAPGSVMTK